MLDRWVGGGWSGTPMICCKRRRVARVSSLVTEVVLANGDFGCLVNAQVKTQLRLTYHIFYSPSFTLYHVLNLILVHLLLFIWYPFFLLYNMANANSPIPTNYSSDKQPNSTTANPTSTSTSAAAVVGDYLVSSKIGQGSFATVFKAVHKVTLSILSLMSPAMSSNTWLPSCWCTSMSALTFLSLLLLYCRQRGDLLQSSRCWNRNLRESYLRIWNPRYRSWRR